MFQLNIIIPGGGCSLRTWQVMQIYIQRNNEAFGPYSREAVLEYINQGIFVPDDDARCDGMASWKKLGKLLDLDRNSGPLLAPHESASLDPAAAILVADPVRRRSARLRRRTPRRHRYVLIGALLLLLASVFILATRHLLTPRFAASSSPAPPGAATPAPDAMDASNGPPQPIPTHLVQQPAANTTSAGKAAAPSTKTAANAASANATSANIAAASGAAPQSHPTASKPIIDFTVPPADLASTTAATAASPAPAPAMAAAEAPLPTATLAANPATTSPPAPPAAATPPPPPPKPFDPADLTAASWPKTVHLKQAEIFPAVFDSRVVGSVTIPAGTAVKLINIQAGRLTVQFQQGQLIVPWQLTDLEQAATSTPAATASRN